MSNWPQDPKNEVSSRSQRLFKHINPTLIFIKAVTLLFEGSDHVLIIRPCIDNAHVYVLRLLSWVCQMPFSSQCIEKQWPLKMNHPWAHSLNGRTSYGKISWSLEAARFDVTMFALIWNFAGISAAAHTSELLEKSKSESHGFETTRDLAVRCPSA